MNRNLEKIINSLDLDVVKDFYLTHTLDETCKEFNVSGYYLNMIIDMYGWKEGRNIRKIAGKKAFSTRVERMGGYENVRSQIKNNCIEGRIRNYGSLEAARKAQADKTRKHFQELYGVDNPMQLESTKVKSENTKIERYGSLEAAEKARYDKAAKTNLERYGYENVSSSPIVKERRAENNFRKYGVTNTFQLPEARKRCVESSKSIEVMEARKNTCLVRYGSSGPMSSPAVKELSRNTCIRKYGVDNVSKVPAIKEKKYHTMQQNGTFTKSEIEEYFYSRLLQLFSADNIHRQYKDNIRYPYRCDFYIASLDLFVEIQGTWLHGPHPYNSDNPEDIELLDNIRKKQHIDNDGRKNMYYAFEEQWTKVDVKKRAKAIENKINFIELYNKAEIDSFIDALKTKMKEV